jgi:hypothetical protein
LARNYRCPVGQGPSDPAPLLVATPIARCRGWYCVERVVRGVLMIEIGRIITGLRGVFGGDPIG